METEKQDILILRLGDFLPVDLKSLCRKLNNSVLQKSFKFVYLEDHIQSEEIGSPELGARCYSGEQLFSLVVEKRTSWFKNEDYSDGSPVTIAIGNIPLSEKEYWNTLRKEHTDLAPDVFADWDVKQKVGVISTHLWLYRYASIAYRSTEQFIVLNILPIILECSTNRELIHYDVRNCICDYNCDLDSIVWLIRNARICDNCRKNLIDFNIGDAQLKDINNLCNFIRRPPYLEIVRYMRNDSFVGIILIGILLLIIEGSSSKWQELLIWKLFWLPFVVFLILFLILLCIKEHYWSGRDLR